MKIINKIREEIMAKKKNYEFTFEVINEKGKVIDSKTVSSETEDEAAAIAEARAVLEKELKPDHILQFKSFKKF